MSCLKISHAVVRLKETDGRYVYYATKIHNIEEFRPQFAQDFNRDQEYTVRWEPSFDGPNNYHRSGRWPGHIMVLGGEFIPGSEVIGRCVTPFSYE